jgi:hypothetical protein
MIKNEWIAFGAGLLIGGLMTSFVLNINAPNNHMMAETHPVGYADNEDEVHVHSDFVVFLNNKQIDLSSDKYQSKSDQILHANIHLHDNNDEVIHRHDHGVTLGTFFESLGFTLTDDCLTTDEAVSYCSNETEELMVFVNDIRINNPVSYVNEEEDQILVYHGDISDNETIRELLLSITDRACIYSGTCPERGIAPPESCGLTCEL